MALNTNPNKNSFETRRKLFRPHPHKRCGQNNFVQKLGPLFVNTNRDQSGLGPQILKVLLILIFSLNSMGEN